MFDIIRRGKLWEAKRRARFFHPDFRVGGVFHAQVCNPDGTVVSEAWAKNGVTNAGLNSILNVQFVSGTQITTWYCGLVDDSGFSAFAAADTMSSHAGWTEITTQYDESVRQTWSPSSASSQAITNSTVMSFTFNASKTVKGIFIVSNSTKGGTSGTLWSTGAFSSSQSLVSTQVLKVTYTLTAAAA